MRSNQRADPHQGRFSSGLKSRSAFCLNYPRVKTGGARERREEEGTVVYDKMSRDAREIPKRLTPAVGTDATNPLSDTI